MKLKHTILILASLLTLPLVSCKDDDKGDTVPPASISNIRFTPNNGGGYFLFDTPADADYLYAKAVYTLDNGQTISKTSSVYNDTLFVEGFGQVKEYPVSIYAIDRKENMSAPIVVNVKPLAPAVDAAIETVKGIPGFSSLIFDWENPLQQSLTIYIRIKVGEKEALKVYTSNLADARYTIEKLEGQPHVLSAYFKDSYGNTSKTVDLGTITPHQDGLLSKSTWSFLRNNLLYGNKWDYNSNTDPFSQVPLEEFQGTWRDDSLKNSREQNFEGRIIKFWNNIRDMGNRLDYFHTGSQSFPFSYFIDLGRSVRISRVKTWQRYSQAWGNENFKVFQLWISDDQDPTDGVDGWELCSTYTVVKPSDPVEATTELNEGSEWIVFPEEPKFSKPFRYLRVKFIRGWINNQPTCCGSEISLYGTEADGSIPEIDEEVK